MSNILDNIFNDDLFTELTKQEKGTPIQQTDPEVVKFQEIISFIKNNGKEPQKTDDWSIERALWARLCGFRDKKERRDRVENYDSLGILKKSNIENFRTTSFESLDVTTIEEVLEKDELKDEFSDLLDVSRYRKTINAADKIGRRKKASEFNKYKSMFNQVYEDIASGKRKIISFEQYDIEEGRFYIQNGVMLYIVSIGNFYNDSHGYNNAKMHVVYENGTENKDLLFRSLASSLYATERHGRMVTDIINDNTLSERFGQEHTTGYIYVLQSLSEDPEIAKINNLYKIGFTRHDIQSRISNAINEATYLKAPVKLVLSAEIKNTNAQILERALHHSFQDKQVIFQNSDFKTAKEWFIIPLEEINMKINEIIASLQK